MLRLKAIFSEEASAEGAQRQTEPSVKVCSKDDIFAFLRVRLHLFFQRNPRLYPFWDSPASAKPIYIRLRNVGAFLGAPRSSLLSLLAFLASLFLFLGLLILMFGIGGFLAEVGGTSSEAIGSARSGREAQRPVVKIRAEGNENLQGRTSYVGLRN